MRTVEVIDNFLTPEEHNIIKSSLLDFEFPWHYSDWVSAEYDKNGLDFYFEHSFYREFFVRSSYFDMLAPMLKKLKVKALIRAKANLYPRVGDTIVKNAFHVDHDYSHYGAVYYVNTNNGYTEFECGTKVESVENRIMLFDSSIPHRSTHCTDQKVRLTINLNYF